MILDSMSDISPYIHSDIVRSLTAYKSLCDITEIRLAINKPVIVSQRGCIHFLRDMSGEVVISDKASFMYTVNKLCGGSLYSISESLKKGFVTIEGGHRVGICGSAVMTGAAIENIKDISALCFRICREIKGCAKDIYKDICREKIFPSCIIASPPGYGKTTVLRDLCRLIATGSAANPPRKVGIADERCEIAAMYGGVSNFELGDCTFVCSGYPKTDAMLLMLRSMSPDVIVTDEIGADEEFRAAQQIKKCGVSVIASVHAFDLEDIIFRFGSNIKSFDCIFFIQDKKTGHTLYRRCNGDY